MAEPLSVDADLLAEEARLARAAAAGDGEAFATLYERYARRAYNLAHRLSGSEDDAADAVQEAFLNVMRRLPELEPGRELAFGSYLFTATRNATYDLMRNQQRSNPSDSIPESAVPIGAGSGGLGLDPGDPDEDPDRKVLLADQREEIQAANARLPERQREVLALRELEDLSYDEIAATMEMNRNSVAQLISRARINLRTELRGEALASIAASSPACERALPLIAMRDDAQLDPGSEDAAWLSGHLADCGSCAVATAAMQEAGASYRAWIPAAVAPWVFKETMARAAELSGSDWREIAARRLQHPTDPAALAGQPPAYRVVAAAPGRHRRRALIGAALGAILLCGVAIGLLAGGEDGTPPPSQRLEVVDATVETPAQPTEKSKPKPAGEEPKPEEQVEPTPEAAPVSEAATPEASAPSATETKAKSTPAPAPSGGGQVDGPRSVTKPTPEPEPAPEPQPEQPAAPEEPTEPDPPREPPREPPRQPPTAPPGGTGR